MGRQTLRSIVEQTLEQHPVELAVVDPKSIQLVDSEFSFELKWNFDGEPPTFPYADDVADVLVGEKPACVTFETVTTDIDAWIVNETPRIEIGKPRGGEPQLSMGRLEQALDEVGFPLIDCTRS